MSKPKLIVVSNRLPFTLDQHKGEWQFQASSGGLVTALAGLKETREFCWVGWPGRDVPVSDQAILQEQFRNQHNCQPVYLSRSEVASYYNGFCNQVLWPLFHYLPNKVNFESSQWESYCRVNEQFAESIMEVAAPNDLVWIHDFHLMLIPQLLRQQRPDLKIGFFLHIPFPSSEVYRILAVRQEILQGLLGADLIGFHTFDYLRHFNSACLRLLGYESGPNTIEVNMRRVRLGVFPIGIDPKRFEKSLKSTACQRHIMRLKKEFSGRKLILGVDRMDYTKGIVEKLQAYEYFLEKNPDWRSKVLLYQVAVPSREDVSAYQELKEQVDELVGRINGQYGSLEKSPVYYINKSISFEHLCALYATADVALITPIRDGMNLVAQEYVLCSDDKKGVLILSEFAGSAHSLSGCLMVNPGNVDEVAQAIERALTMQAREWERRNTPMRHLVQVNTATRWGERFINELEQAGTVSEEGTATTCVKLKQIEADLLGSYDRATSRLLFLDYDGTLTPIQATPAEAIPDFPLLALLGSLAKDPKNKVSVISGRERSEIKEWFDHMPLHLCAEHGYVFRDLPEADWQTTEEVDLSWKESVYDVLEFFRERTPGALIEDKPSSLSWHYRRAEPVFGQWQADELLNHLEEILAKLPVEAVSGHKVIEVRPIGIHKGRFVQHMLNKYPQTDFILCLGDDATDEDMYKVLPPDAWSCHIGSSHTAARCYAESQAQAIQLLEALAGKS